MCLFYQGSTQLVNDPDLGLLYQVLTQLAEVIIWVSFIRGPLSWSGSQMWAFSGAHSVDQGNLCGRNLSGADSVSWGYDMGFFIRGQLSW